jgi:hypothetical protein
VAEFSDESVVKMQNLYSPEGARFTVVILLRMDENYFLYITGDEAVKAFFILESHASKEGDFYKKRKNYEANILDYYKNEYGYIVNARCIYDKEGVFRGLIAVKKWLRDMGPEKLHK